MQLVMRDSATHDYDFLFKVNVRGGCFGCVCVGKVGLVGGCARLDASNPLCARAFGLSGDRTALDREGGLAGPSPPVTFRRICGRKEDGAAGVDVVGPFVAGLSFTVKPAKGVVSVPRACLRAFSCRPCTIRK